MPASQIASQLGLERDQVILGATELPRLAAASIAQQHRPLVIAVDGSYPNDRSSRYPGIELLTWLRLKHKHNAPILLVGFQTAEDILAKHPEHLIMLAPGNRYERLPINAGSENHLRNWLAKDTNLTKENIEENYKTYLVSSFDITRYRHRMANIFGLKVLWDIHACADKSFKKPYPPVLKSALESIHSWIAGTIMGNDREKVEKAVIAYADAIRGELQQAKERLNTIVEKLKDTNRVEREWDEIISNAQTTIDQIKAGIEHVNDPVERIDWQRKVDKENADIAFALAERSKVKEQSKEQSIQRDELHRVVVSASDRLQGSEHTIPQVKEARGGNERASERRPRILHIDDEKDKGWECLVKHLVYGDEKQADKSGYTAPDTTAVLGGNNELLSKRVQGLFDALKLDDIDLVLLDMRLYPPIDATCRDPRELSGSQLLAKIREKHLSVPVVITSASNKIWSYRTMMELGADEFWLKEGWDYDWALEDSIKNYVRLRELALNVMHPLVQSLRALERVYHSVTMADRPWWKDGIWRSGDQKQGDTETARMFHYSALKQLKLYSQRFILAKNIRVGSQGSGVTKDGSLMLATVANQLGSLTEAIVVGDIRKGAQHSSKRMERVRAYPVKEILDIRALASHKEAVTLQEDELMRQIQLVNEFLLDNHHYEKRDDHGTPYIGRLGRKLDMDTREVIVQVNGRDENGLIDDNEMSLIDRGLRGNGHVQLFSPVADCKDGQWYFKPVTD